METFFAGVHLNYQNHFEDTPREAARVHTLAASLLLGQNNLDDMGSAFSQLSVGETF